MIDLQTFINQVLATGKPVGSGECGELVDLWLVEGYGVRTSYPNAIDYWTNGLPGFQRVNSPEPGDLACYDAHPGYPDGHIAIYAGNGEVFEQNADPDGALPHVYLRANTYLLGYLRYNGGNMKPDPNQVNQLVTLCWGPGAATKDDITSLNAQPTVQAMLNALLGDNRTAVWDAEVYRLLNQTSTLNKNSVIGYLQENLQ